MSEKDSSRAATSFMLFVLLVALGANLWGSARNGRWIAFTFSLFEFWVIGGVLFWFGIERFNAAQKHRRSLNREQAASAGHAAPRD